MREETVHPVAGWKRPKDENKDLDMPSEVNKVNMAGVVKASFACVIGKAIVVKTYGDYSKYATPDERVIARMLPLVNCSDQICQVAQKQCYTWHFQRKDMTHNKQ